MENSVFNIKFDATTGGICSLERKDDLHHMNWVADECVWGIMNSVNYEGSLWGVRNEKTRDLELVSFYEAKTEAVSEYTNGMISVRVERSFTDTGVLLERYTITNVGTVDLFLGQDSFSIEVPFSDRYTSAEECMIHHCNTHIWCGHNSTYIQAQKMGVSDIGVGLVLKQGAIESYSVRNVVSNNRGVFMLNLAHTELMPEESTVLEWEVFPYSDTQDFYNKLKQFDSYIDIKAEHFTVFDGEKIEFVATSLHGCDSAEVYLDETEVPVSAVDGGIRVSFNPTRYGEHRFWIQMGNCKTHADFYVSIAYEELLKKRIEFLVDKQQYRRAGSMLDGAFLIYDNREQHLVFNQVSTDHNACRERIGMAMLLAEYLKTHPNEKWKESLQKYVDFLYREFFDCESGVVYDRVQKSGRIRLYNAPWVAMFLADLYELTQESKYLDDIVVLLTTYYQKGGTRFYPNAFSYKQIYEVFEKAGRFEDARTVLDLFHAHATNMANTGTAYPIHEVNYEQTIVSPAATLLTDMGHITKEPYWMEKAEEHVKILERFDGHQPSCHLYEIPIRYWDDFWFGKGLQMGDTFPHYWSCLTASAFENFYQLNGEQRYHKMAEECMRNCFCIFNEKGEGSCAYVYPYMIDGNRCEFNDDWANDQDFALYYSLKMYKESIAKA